VSEHRNRDREQLRSAAARHWTDEFLRGSSGARGGVEAATGPTHSAPTDRIDAARQAMLRIVTDRFGGDDVLRRQVESMTLTAQEAIDVLRERRDDRPPSGAQMASLEAVVTFDGTRPSFLLRRHEIDFSTSFNTGDWKTRLQPFLTLLPTYASCVGRVDVDDRHFGTAFLVTPTLAITNRHVVQAMADFAGGRIELHAGATVDFGREDHGFESFDRREIVRVVFAGERQVEDPIDHERLDLAVIQLSPSGLSGADAQRYMCIGGVTMDDLVNDSRFLATIGYPADPERFVPDGVWDEYGEVIRRLLEGAGGAKRFAPGQPMQSVRAGLTEWTATHDATTINGNSGSPLLKMPAQGEGTRPRAAGLHYGGRSGGTRVNWAHLLHYAGDKSGYGNAGSFREFCQREGIDWS
jgi:V8-like Glu-specific endopeptidase